MPINSLKSEITTVGWDIGREKIDRRTTYISKTELKIISSSYPYTIRLEERPYQTIGTTVTGYTEILVMPTSNTDFYVDYENSTIYFHSSQAGKLVTVYYMGCGSVVAANDVNMQANFLCSLKDFLVSFFVEPTDPVSTNVNITGGYVNSGTSLSVVADKILKFGAGQEYVVTAMSAFYWRKLIVSINTNLNSIVVTEGSAAVTEDSAIVPDLPYSYYKPCVIISAQDNGSAGAGTIVSITSDNIKDVRNMIYS